VSDHIHAISPLDGRYKTSVKDLSTYFSEYSLIYHRLFIEIEYLIALGDEKTIKELPPFSKNETTQLRKIYQKFDGKNAQEIKKIESTINHDVKAVEYFIRKKVKKSLHHWIHFALTSEDVNNLSYSIMWQSALKQSYLKLLQSVINELKKLSRKYKSAPLLSRTHGQPATTTTFGKELAVFSYRLNREMNKLNNHTLLGKFGGATGTWSAQTIAYPNTNWIRFASKFIKSVGLEPNLITTQIEPHDSISESYHHIIRINSIFLDFCRDMWSYISRDLIGQKQVGGEVGSSTMPHKINPIQFENAEGNIGISNAILNHLATKLPISRLQRDLTDSTSLRNQGVGLAHSYLALKNILKGLHRIRLNKNQMLYELENHWEVLGEAIQTILRKNGKEDAYEELKKLTRGQSIDKNSIEKFILELKINPKDKEVLLNLTPGSYTGIADELIDLL